MDSPEENITQREMLEKIAEMDHSQSQLRDLNAEMRLWLDVADDEVAALRSENASLRKQVKAQEKTIFEAQQVEAEPCRSTLADDLQAERCRVKQIQKLEEESTVMKEQNKKITSELKMLLQERDQDKISLSHYSVALQTLKLEIDEAQLGLQNKDEVIQQKDLQLNHLEETVEEYSNIIKDLRETNRELREQLEDRQDEASFAIVINAMEEKEGLPSPPLSFAEEIKLLASLVEVKTSMSDSITPVEIDAEEPLEAPSRTLDIQTPRCAGIVETARLLLLFIFILIVLAFGAFGGCGGNCDTLWDNARLMLLPYCRVHYRTLPPI